MRIEHKLVQVPWRKVTKLYTFLSTIQNISWLLLPSFALPNITLDIFRMQWKMAIRFVHQVL